MEYKALKQEIVEISKIAQAVPEEFRAKCFEVLLNNLLGNAPNAEKSRFDPGEEAAPPADEPPELEISGGVKIFLKRTKTAHELLAAVVAVEDGQVHFIAEPDPANKSEGLLQWGLLQALRSGLQGGDLSVDPEALRSLCQEKGCYDRNNFSKNLTRKLDPFVTGELESQGEARKLSAAGEKELAKLITELAGGA